MYVQCSVAISFVRENTLHVVDVEVSGRIERTLGFAVYTLSAEIGPFQSMYIRTGSVKERITPRLWP
jgi:hypothetical protein